MREDVNADCAAMLALVSAYLDGDLDPGACEAIEAHCRTCGRCPEVIKGLRETIGMCRDAGRAPLPQAVRQRAKASIDRLLAAEKPTPR